MKKILLISVMFIMLIFGSALAAESLITIAPLGLVWGTANVEYSGLISDSSSWAIRALYTPNAYYVSGITGIGGGLSYRGFFNPTALAGPFWGIGVDFIDLTGKYSQTSISTFFVEPKIELVYTYIASGGLAVGLGGFLGYGIGNIPASVPSNKFGGFDAGVELKIGYGW